MAKDAITKINPVSSNLPAKPEFLQGEEPEGLEEMGKYVVPSRIKVIQDSAKAPLKKLFGVGDVILSPQNVCLLKMERDSNGSATGKIEPLVFTPLFFFVEYCEWEPFAAGSENPIRARSFDENSDLAKRARTKELRYMDHPDHPGDGKWQIRFVEHLNFMIQLHGTDQIEPVTLGFSRGEWVSGSKFMKLQQMRAAPIYSGIYEARLSYRNGSEGDWWGFDIANPDGISWVTDEDAYEAYKKSHAYFKKLHEDSLIRPDYSDAESEPAPVSTEEM